MKIYEKLFICGILILLVLPLINAESLGVYKQNNCVSLIQTCSDCTFVNISSVLYPNSTKALGEVTMTKTGTFYNYSFCDASTLGVYNVNGHGNENSIDTVWAYDFEITATGTSLSTGQSIIYFIFLVASILIFFISLYYAIKIQWQHQKDEEGYVIGINDLRWVKIFCIVICYLVLMSIMGLMRGITANFVPEIGVSGLFEWLYWIMLAGVFPIIVCGFTFALINFLNNKKIQRALRRGIQIQ